jgi:hypothetical protein
MLAAAPEGMKFEMIMPGAQLVFVVGWQARRLAVTQFAATLRLFTLLGHGANGSLQEKLPLFRRG